MRPTLILFLALVGASTGRAEELAKLNLATVLPLTGPQEAYGKEAGKGVELALDVLHQQDPALAGRVVLLSGDDQSGPGAADATSKLIDKDRANLVIGSVTTATTSAIAAEAKKRQTPMIAPITAQAAVGVGGEILRGCAGEGAQGEILAAFALRVLGLKQAATLREDGLGATPFAERFAAAFKAGGGTIAAQETYDLGTEDFTPALKRIQATGAKLIVTAAPYQTAAQIMQQGKKVDPELRFMGGDGWDTAALSRLAGPAVQGSFYVTPFNADDPDATTQAFVKAFKQKFGRAPGALAAQAYDATLLGVDAFRRARTSLKTPLAEALEKTAAFNGATGQLLAFVDGEPVKSMAIMELTPAGAKFKARGLPASLPAVAAEPGAASSPGSEAARSGAPAKGH